MSKLRLKTQRHHRHMRFTGKSLLGLLMFITLPALVASQGTEKADPWRIEAAFLRNFASYVTWPESAFSGDHSPWHVCILGSDPFGNALEYTLNGRTEKGRPFRVLRTNRIGDLHQCQIVYMAYMAGKKRRSALAKIKHLPVLTVSNAPEFLEEGGIIRFDVTDYVKININLDQARAASLSIQTKMLEVSNDVIVDGKVRTVR